MGGEGFGWFEGKVTGICTENSDQQIISVLFYDGYSNAWTKEEFQVFESEFLVGVRYRKRQTIKINQNNIAKNSDNSNVDDLSSNSGSNDEQGKDGNRNDDTGGANSVNEVELDGASDKDKQRIHDTGLFYYVDTRERGYNSSGSYS
eukprot:14443258-Ditylum_brightwellii.AAC.1